MSSDVHLNGRSVLVTGASGFIGRVLSARLLEAGAEVHALSRQHFVGLEADAIRWHRADLTDPHAVRELVESVGADTVFHLAAAVLGDPGPEQVRPMLENNLLGTVNLLTAVHEVGCRRMVVTGSVVEPRDGEPPSSPYAAAKAASTAHAQMFHALYGTPVVCLRLAMVYGPGQEDESKLIPHVVGSLLRHESPRLSNGLWEVDWVYVDDVVDALVLASLAEGVEGAALDVGSGQKTSVRTVVEKLAAEADSGVQPAFGVLPDRPLQHSVSPDVDQTRRALAWAPSTSLPTGIKQTVKWHATRLAAALCLCGALITGF